MSGGRTVRASAVKGQFRPLQGETSRQSSRHSRLQMFQTPDALALATVKMRVSMRLADRDVVATHPIFTKHPMRQGFGHQPVERPVERHPVMHLP